jgi:hypothetical protein
LDSAFCRGDDPRHCCGAGDAMAIYVAPYNLLGQAGGAGEIGLRQFRYFEEFNESHSAAYL